MVVFDASFLILVFDDKAVEREGVPRLRERIDILLSDLSKAKTKILIPTPALSEFLVRADLSVLQTLNTTSSFKIVPFDQKAAIEAADLTRSAISIGDKKDPVTAATWSKIKFDRQIVATAKAEGAETIYSTDTEVAKHAQRVNIPCFGIADLPTAPPIQDPLPLDEGTPAGG